MCDFCHGKETPGVAGTHKGQWDTQGTHARAQTGTRITQTNLTTIQTHKHTRTAIQTVKPVDLCWGYMLAKQNPGTHAESVADGQICQFLTALQALKTPQDPFRARIMSRRMTRPYMRSLTQGLSSEYFRAN